MFDFLKGMFGSSKKKEKSPKKVGKSEFEIAQEKQEAEAKKVEKVAKREAAENERATIMNEAFSIIYLFIANLIDENIVENDKRILEAQEYNKTCKNCGSKKVVNQFKKVCGNLSVSASSSSDSWGGRFFYSSHSSSRSSSSASANLDTEGVKVCRECSNEECYIEPTLLETDIRDLLEDFLMNLYYQAQHENTIHEEHQNVLNLKLTEKEFAEVLEAFGVSVETKEERDAERRSGFISVYRICHESRIQMYFRWLYNQICGRNSYE